jgi:hypothetical protein
MSCQGFHALKDRVSPVAETAAALPAFDAAVHWPDDPRPNPIPIHDRRAIPRDAVRGRVHRDVHFADRRSLLPARVIAAFCFGGAAIGTLLEDGTYGATAGLFAFMIGARLHSL